MRAALGCSRARVVRQLLTESVVFALCGGAAGLLIANWSLGVLVSLMPGDIRRIDHIALDGYVLAACLVLSTGTALLFGLLPALYASRLDPGAALKESALLTTPSRRRIRGALIVSEVALSVALLTGAGLMMKTFLHLRPAKPGLRTRGQAGGDDFAATSAAMRTARRGRPSSRTCGSGSCIDPACRRSSRRATCRFQGSSAPPRFNTSEATVPASRCTRRASPRIISARWAFRCFEGGRLRYATAREPASRL